MKVENVSIKWKLIGYMFCFTGAILVLLWLFQVAFLDDFYERIKVSEIKDAAKIISQNIDGEDFETSVSTYAFDKGMCVDIVDENGKEVYTLDSIPTCTTHRLHEEEKKEGFIRVVANGGTDTLFTEASRPINAFAIRLNRAENGLKEEISEAAMEVPFAKTIVFEGVKHKGEGYSQTKNLQYSQIAQKDGQEVLIVLNTTISPLGATTEILKVEIFYITGILLVFSVLLAYVIYRKISKPIIQTNNSARELAKANYGVTFEQQGYKEIVQLNETLNFAAVELGKTEALQRELLSNISHDLRTPLTLIVGYAEVMRDIPGENTPENVQVIIDESNRLSNLVTDILDISKLQASVTGIDLERISITECIQSVLCRYSKLVEQEGYKITFENYGEAHVMADEIKFLQVLYNLINNAINYTGSDKTVLIKQTVLNKKVKIEIIDTGDGIEAENLPYIWDRYYKGSKTHNRGAVGSGLGLAIVKNVLKLHNANFSVESVVGEGSDFWFEMDTVE